MYGLLEDGRIAAIDPHEEGKRDTLLAIDRKTGSVNAGGRIAANARQ